MQYDGKNNCRCDEIEIGEEAVRRKGEGIWLLDISVEYQLVNF